MGYRLINYYEFPETEPNWAELKQLFKRNVSKFNIPYFTDGSDEEREFLSYCINGRHKFERRTIVEYTGSDSDPLKFLYLVIKDDRGACIGQDATSFIDYSAACPGDESSGDCGDGAKQIGELQINESGLDLIAKNGLVSTRNPSVPSIILVSNSVMDALEDSNATGVEFRPTNSSDCFQLCITGRTLGPTRVGKVNLGFTCAKCGLVQSFTGSEERYFENDDIGPEDFQICEGVAGDNVEPFRVLNGFPIVAQRIFDVFLKMKLKGLDRYTTDPPIKHAVVQVR